MQLDASWLGTHLGHRLTAADARRLHAMDRPERMHALSALGTLAASRQVRDSHFPRRFDLGA